MNQLSKIHHVLITTAIILCMGTLTAVWGFNSYRGNQANLPATGSPGDWYVVRDNKLVYVAYSTLLKQLAYVNQSTPMVIGSRMAGHIFMTKFEVANDGPNDTSAAPFNGIAIRNKVSSAAAINNLAFLHNRYSSNGGNGMPLAGDMLGNVTYGALNAAGTTYVNGVAIRGYASEPWVNNGARGSYLVFYTTTSSGNGTKFLPKMYLLGRGSLQFANQMTPPSGACPRKTETAFPGDGYLYQCISTNKRQWGRTQFTVY